MRKIKKTYSPLTNLILYVLLLVATPFLLLQNYLQSFIGKLSLYMLNVGKMEIPYIVIIALIIAIFLIIKNLKYLTKFRLISLVVVVLLMVIGQKLSDFYFNHKFYELQHNWHYFAYGIYSYIAYRYFKSKNKSDAKIILFTFITAVSASTFDEYFQLHLSDRIFDIGDIGKDMWGTVMGTFFIFFVLKEGTIIKGNWRFREKKLKNYLNNPFAIFSFELIFTVILLAVSSQLTNIEYLGYSVFISVIFFLIFFFIFHFSQRKIIKQIVTAILIIYILVQGFFFLKYRNEGIIHNSYGITIYKGIPLLFFDVMIFENGNFRFVDKKHDFNTRDINTIYHYSNNILLIGSGEDGLGGNGFPEKLKPHFIFNVVKLKPLQIIILNTPEACRKYNQLKKEGYNVIFIIHNTC